MFGHRYFGARYYGQRYWGGVGEDPPPQPPVGPQVPDGYDLLIARGGPQQPPLRGDAWEPGTDDPQEPYPPERFDSILGDSTQLQMDGSGWRRMIRRLDRHRQ